MKCATQVQPKEKKQRTIECGIPVSTYPVIEFLFLQKAWGNEKFYTCKDLKAEIKNTQDIEMNMKQVRRAIDVLTNEIEDSAASKFGRYLSRPALLEITSTGEGKRLGYRWKQDSENFIAAKFVKKLWEKALDF